MKGNLKRDREGYVGKNKFGSVMKVVQYNSTTDVTVEFEQGNKVHTTWARVMSGNVKNVFDLSVFGVGYMGDGPYTAGDGKGKATHAYKTWYGMLNRCYNPTRYRQNKAYEGCSVAEEWHNFQNFARWYENNYYEVKGETVCLDKDILVRGNKTYSPDTCIFVPYKINSMMVSTPKTEDGLPVGVRKLKGKYIATLNKNYLGSFNTSEEAFKVYKAAKEDHIKKVAEKYRNIIPIRLHYALMNYEV